MAKLSIVAGATSQSVNLFIQNSSLTNGSGLTGLAYNTAGLTAYYTFAGANATATAITLATLAAVNSAYSSGGFKEIDATNMPGVYRLDLPNAVIAASKGRSVVVYLQGATNMAPCVLEIELTAVDNQDAVRMGMTALPNANAAASGGLIINGSNSGTVTLAALTVTGSLTVSDGLLVSRSTSNQSAIVATGNGTGHGMLLTSGSGATGNGLQATAASTNGDGFASTGTGTGAGRRMTGGATGNGLIAVGGSTSGDAILTSATSGHGATFAGSGTTKHGINATGGATTSHGINAVGGGVGHGILATSGGGSTGDGIRAVAASTNGNGVTFSKVGSGVDLNASRTALVLVKTMNITGFNHIPATVIVSSGGIHTSSGAVTTVTNLTNAPTAGDFTSTMKTSLNAATPASVTGSVGSVVGAVGSVTGSVGSVTGNVGGNVAGSVGSVGTGGITASTFASNAITAAAIAADAIGASELAADAVAEIQSGLATASSIAALNNLSASAVSTAVWDAATASYGSIGTYGALIETNLDAAISTRLASGSYTAPDNSSITAIKAKTDNLPADPADASDIAASFSTVNMKLDTIDDYIDTEVAAIKAKTDNLPSDPADASDIAASFATVNSNIATLTGYVDTEVAAIKAKTDNLPADPADASDIAASFVTVNAKLDAIDDFVDTEIAAIKAKTDLIPASPAAVSDIPTAAQNAVELLKHDMSTITGEASRSPLNALRILRNKIDTSGGQLDVYGEDDTTIKWTATYATDPAALPIVTTGV